MTRVEDERFAGVAKALGHPLRVRIVGFLAKQEECIVGELADHFSVAQSTMSEHLRILRDAGIVRGTIEGPRTCYCLDPGTLAWFEAAVRRRLGSVRQAVPPREVRPRVGLEGSFRPAASARRASSAGSRRSRDG